MSSEEKIIAIKGFNRDMTCRGFQFSEGKTYTHEGEVEACSSGFHAIEGHPLEVFNYYAPGSSVYREVECSGSISRHGSDSKIACAQITIRAELSIPALVARAVKWVMDRSTPEGPAATGYQGAASATGYQGAASATGDQGAASATGYQGAASATGDQGAASATGYQGAASATGTRGAASATGDQGAASATGTRGAASATGDQGAASATGDWGAAMASGCDGRVSGAAGCALFLTERDEEGEIIAVWAGIAGRDGIEPGVFYTLRDGAPTKVDAS